jgi:type II secretory pathway pseudopilin PulG
MRPSTPRRNSSGFTLMEIMTALVVIMILVTLLIPAYEEVKVRVEKVSCTNNLRQLYVGGAAYLQEYGHWPQVNPALLQASTGAYDEAWIEALLPFAIGRSTWICPTIQRELGAPDYTQQANYRTDYVAMPFDAKARTPFKWAGAPWFVERGNVHGNGNLVIESNGVVTELVQAQRAPSASPTP